MTTAALIADTDTAVIGTLLHADAFDLLDAATVAQRSAVTAEQAAAALDRFACEGAVLSATVDGERHYRLTTAGVQFARELTGEVPRAWRS